MLCDRFLLHNVQQMIPDEESGREVCSRVPQGVRDGLEPGARRKALLTAGCEVRFNHDGEVRFAVDVVGPEPALAELWYGNFCGGMVLVGPGRAPYLTAPPARMDLLMQRQAAEKLPFDPHLCRLILPYAAKVAGVRFEGRVSPPRAEQMPARRILAYGSSITQGASAMVPSGSYAMVTARRLGMDLINLGFGGSCHCEAAMADHIASRDDWDVCWLELGINMCGGFEVDEFRRRVQYLVRRVAEAHRQKWVFCIDLFAHWRDYGCDADVAAKRDAFRAIVRETVAELNAPKLVHVDGRDVLPVAESTGLRVDLLHPGPDGMVRMGRTLSRIIAEHLETKS